jgi:hypothetical protein
MGTGFLVSSRADRQADHAKRQALDRKLSFTVSGADTSTLCIDTIAPGSVHLYNRRAVFAGTPV